MRLKQCKSGSLLFLNLSLKQQTDRLFLPDVGVRLDLRRGSHLGLVGGGRLGASVAFRPICARSRYLRTCT